jgi:hypothetical protein
MDTNMSLSSLYSICGMALCILAAVQLLLSICLAIQRIVNTHRMSRKSQDLLCAQIASAQRSLILPDRPTHAWEGYRKFRVRWKIKECVDCYSLHLVPHDGKKLPPFTPGQYITIALKLPHVAKPLVRCYSLSDAPRQDFYRITVTKTRRRLPSGEISYGQASSHLCDVVTEGDLVDVQAPRGAFVLNTESDRPVVLLAGGIGMTPLLSMLCYLVESNSPRMVYVFHGVRNSARHPFKLYLEQLARDHSNVQIRIFYSSPLTSDRIHVDYHYAGHVEMDHVRRELPCNNFEFFVCGPTPFLASLARGLEQWGVPLASIHTEAFGTDSAKCSIARFREEATHSNARIEFARSHKSADWSDIDQTILDIAESLGICIDSGCRSGNCGTCATAIKTGSVQYLDHVTHDVAEGVCLPCIAIPDGPVVLDA